MAKHLFQRGHKHSEETKRKIGIANKGKMPWIKGKKGIIKIGGKDLTKEETDKIALIAPDATVNIIQNYDVKKKIKVAIPLTVNKIIKCSNPNCITNNEKVMTKFDVLNKVPLKVRCHYCERYMAKEDITLL